MGSIMAQKTCHGKNGHTRFVIPCFALPKAIKFVILNLDKKPILYFQVGMKGEAIDLYSPSKISSVDWVEASLAANRQQPLTWYKVTESDAFSN